MLEYVASRVKFSFMIVLFLSPIFAAAWNRELDEWFKQNHRYEGDPQMTMQVDMTKTIIAK